MVNRRYFVCTTKFVIFKKCRLCRWAKLVLKDDLLPYKYTKMKCMSFVFCLFITCLVEAGKQTKGKMNTDQVYAVTHTK